MTGFPLVFAFIATIVLMIVAISKWKIHPFLSIIGVSLIFAIIAGVDLIKIPDVVGEGFSGTFTSIGIVIILGALVGVFLEQTGAAVKIAECVIKVVGKKHPIVALMIMGWIVSIPVFADSGFVVLNPIRKALVKKTGASSVAATEALALGLTISHCFIPPTPGPLAAANTLFGSLGLEVNLVMLIGIGILCSILPLIAGCFFAIFIGKRVKSKDEITNSTIISQSYEELVASYGKLPNAFLSFAPIVVPIILMAINSILSMFALNCNLLLFLGKPIIALSVGLIIAIVLLVRAKKIGKFYELTDETLKTVGPILFVTAAGSVLGKVISLTDLVNIIKINAGKLQSLGLIFPFLIASLLKMAQGSSTVAITTTSSILAPLLVPLGYNTPIDVCLLIVAIGAGSAVVAHANDSFFWLIVNIGEIKPEEGYQVHTLGTLVIGIAAVVNVLLVSLFV